MAEHPLIIVRFMLWWHVFIICFICMGG